MKTLLIIFSTLLLSVGASAQSSGTYVRYNANSVNGQRHLDAMQVAFDSLRKMDCTNGLAWYYQGAIHNIPGVINGTNALCPEYQTSSDKLYAWGDCTHTSTPASSFNFLLWHRMYTWHFEKIVRELSGVADFAIPYWNYGGPTPADNTMTEHMRATSSSLYEPARYSVMNSGQLIQAQYISSIQNAIQELFGISKFGGRSGFSKAVESSPHNFMHSYIGGAYANPSESYYNQIYQNQSLGLMAQVPSAGFDPIFWLHHSMIDRIWTSWDVTPTSERPTLAELQANSWTYDFIEPNGTRVSYTMDQIYTKVFNLDYTYDVLLTPQPTDLAMVETNGLKAAQQIASTVVPEETIVWKQTVGRTLSTDEFSSKISSEFGKSTNKSIKNSLKNITNTTLSLNLNLVVYKEPQDFYTVYLRYPDQEDKFVGLITFFGIGHEHGTGENHEIGEMGVKLTYSYHVSDDLMKTKTPFEVIIVKNGIDATQVTVESISLTKVN